MKVITLLENTKEPESTLIAKHGLSLYVETEHNRLLFDIGPDDSSLKNAEELGIDLSKVDILVISHAHYDHGGGLEAFLRMNNQAQVFVSSGVQGEYFVRRSEGELDYIGLDRSVLKQYQDRIHYLNQNEVITPGITLIKTTEHSSFVPKAILLKKEKDDLIQDSFEHELIMVMEVKEDLYVFTGCSHNGIINMVRSVENVFPNKRIQMVIGGFHLMNTKTGTLAEEEVIVKDLARSLLEHDISQIYTGHCTGGEGLKVLKTVLGDRIRGIFVGQNITIPG